ncbi:MAG: acetyltransferase [Nitrospina sp.]|nr:acetyltransferase [Nitrospina sp.]
MTQESILLVGAGGHARACIDVIEQEGSFVVQGLVGLPDEVGTRILNYPVMGTDADLSTLIGDFSNALISIGQIKTPELRIRLFNELQKSSYILPVIVSPTAYVSPHAKLDAGTIVMHGAVVNAGAVIGRNCIINSLSLVEHDVVVADHCHISTGATVNSGVRIGTGSFIGSNSSIKQGVNIGEGCIIGMGQQVLFDCEGGALMR